jgi:hypothetical protein
LIDRIGSRFPRLNEGEASRLNGSWADKPSIRASLQIQSGYVDPPDIDPSAAAHSHEEVRLADVVAM